MKKIILTILFLVSISKIQAQHTISGLVTDKTDNSVLIEGVHVYVPEFGRTALSREGGTYIVRNIGIGTVHIQFTKRGYKTILKVISTIDSATVINIEMEPTSFTSKEVTVTSGLSKLANDLPLPVMVIPSSSIKRSGQISILSSLAYEPGIDKVSVGNICQPMIRGLSGNRVLLYQSGSRIEGHSWNELQDNRSIDEGTDNVEIIKGPASLLYGDNAMAGVLVYRDEKMPEAGTVKGDFNLGLFSNTLGVNADAGIKGASANGLFYSVRIGGKSHTSYIQGDRDQLRKNTEQKDYAYNSGFSSADARGVIGISKKWGQSRLTLAYRNSQNELIRSYTDSAIALMETNNEQTRSIRTPFVDQSSVLVSSENIFLVRKSQVDLNLSWQMNDRSDWMKFTALNFDVKYITDASKKAGLTIGSQGNIRRNGTSTFQYIPDHDAIGVYSLFRYDLPKLNLLAGIRYDSKMVNSGYLTTSQKYNMVSGSAGVAWHPASSLTLKLTGSSGYTIPVELRNLYYFQTLTGFINGDGNLKEERNYEGDLGLIWEKNSITLSFDAYYNSIRNYIYLSRNNYIVDIQNILNNYSYRQANSNLKGGELSLSIHPSFLNWIQLNTSYGLVRGRVNGTKTNLPDMPADKFVVALRLQSERKDYLYQPFIEFVYSDHFRSDWIFSDSNSMNYYTLFDLHVGGSFKWGQQKFDLTLSLNNIFNTGYYNELSPLQYLSPVPVKEMGRNVALQLRLPFGLMKKSS